MPIVFTIIALLLLPPASFASEIDYSQIPIPLFGGFSPSPTFGELFVFLYGLALLISGVTLFSAVFTFGFQFLTSGANPGKRTEAKRRLAGALLGSVMLLGIFFVLHAINPQLATIPGERFAICDSSEDSAEEAKETSLEEQNEEQNENDAGLPPDCKNIALPTLHTFQSSSGSSNTGTSSSSQGTSSPPAGSTTTTSTTSGSCNVIDPSTDPANPCAYTELQSFGIANASGSATVNEIHASQICNAETGGNPFALNNNCLAAVAGNNTTGDYSVGLFQLNLYAGTGPSGGGRCPGAFTYINSKTCTIANQNILISCAQQYGVTLQFDAAHPYGTIIGDTVLTEVSQAVQIWKDNQQKFCGTWSMASESKCALCPNN